MPKGKGKSKGKKGGKSRMMREKDDSKTIRMRQQGEQYARVEKILGDCRFSLSCYDNFSLLKGQNIDRIGRLSKSQRRNGYIVKGDFVLVSLREYQDEKCEIIHKYKPQDVKFLQKIKELPEEEIEEHDYDDFENIEKGENVKVEFDFYKGIDSSDEESKEEEEEEEEEELEMEEEKVSWKGREKKDRKGKRNFTEEDD